MARASVRYVAKNPKGDEVFRITVPGRSFKAAEAKAKRIFRRRGNIFAGFHDDTGFHPIRASADYSASRAGEGSRKKKGRKKKKSRRR